MLEYLCLLFLSLAMKLDNANRVKSDISLENLIGEPDPNIAEYLNNPRNPRWVIPITTKDFDGAELAVVTNDPHYGAAQHIVRVEDGKYASFAQGQIIGEVFERDID